MRMEDQTTPSKGKSFSPNFNSFNLNNTSKLVNNINYEETNFSTNSQQENPFRYALKYPETRLFTESKKTKLNDMKKNVCDRLMNRIINHRRERMDNILYYKPSIIEKCKNEYYEVYLLINIRI